MRIQIQSLTQIVSTQQLTKAVRVTCAQMASIRTHITIVLSVDSTVVKHVQARTIALCVEMVLLLHLTQ